MSDLTPKNKNEQTIDPEGGAPQGDLIPPYPAAEIARSATHAFRIRGFKGPMSQESALREGASRVRVVGESDLPFVSRYASSIRDLMSDKARWSAFQALLEDYQQAWDATSVLGSTDLTGNRIKDVAELLRRMPGAQGHDSSCFDVPIAALFDLCNRSPLGLYGQPTPAVTAGEDSLKTNFVTLTHLPEFRHILGLHAKRVAERFRAISVPMDLIVIGDGSGELGASIGEQLREDGWGQRIIHVDISQAMLEQQRDRYERSGAPSGRIVSIQGSALGLPELIANRCADSQGAFIVVHEIFDDLRSHLLRNTPSGIVEVALRLDLEEPSISLVEHAASHPLLARLEEFLPQVVSEPRGDLRTFCPEATIFLKSLIDAFPHSAIYVGDYSGNFAHGHFAGSRRANLPVRFHPMMQDERDALVSAILTPVAATADIFPAGFLLAEAFGGRVEQMTDQLEFANLVDPSVARQVFHEAQKLMEQVYSRELTPWSEASQQLLKINMVDPTLAAILITKDLPETR